MTSPEEIFAACQGLSAAAAMQAARAGAREKASNARIAALEKAAMELAGLLAGGDEGG
jgi:hypothetical protein